MKSLLKKMNRTEATGLADAGYLIIRAGFGLMVSTHGYAKLTNFAEYSQWFSDPIGLGVKASLTLAMFAEFFCALFIALGLFTRMAAIPVVFTFLVIVFVVHGNDPFGDKETAVAYLVFSIGILLAGSGKLSLDRKLGF